MHHDWRRYWSKWDGIPSGPTSGFLPQMDSAHRLLTGFAPRTSEELRNVPCLVLVGEPGIGKSTEVEVEKCRIVAKGHTVALCDLKEFSSADEIEEAIFAEPLSADDPTTVFLDSIDEGRNAIDNLLAPLQRMLRRRLADGNALAGIRLRITCRSQEWPKPLGDELRTIFGEQGVGFWHLCPLQRSDAVIAAQSQGLDPESFLNQIAAARAEPLAAKPVTLELLLRISKTEGRLPSEQAEVYRRGLAALCLDPNKWRLAEGKEAHIGRLGKRERLAIARRIAALSIICQRPFINRHETPDLTDSVTLSLDELCASPAREPVEGDDRPFDIRDVKEVLDCGLFRGAEDGRITWAHLTYGEFLAADYLAKHGLDHDQIDNMVKSPGESRVAPQMREVSAWLSALVPQYGAGLLDENPDVLLRSDVIVTDDASRLRLAASYLQKIDRSEIEYRGTNEFLPRLAGHGLAKVLRPYLAELDWNEDARLAAIEMAGACRCQEAEVDLIVLALDSSQPAWLRRRAVRQIPLVNACFDKPVLQPLLGEADDELRGAAIDLLWPGHISTAEMLSAVKPPRTRTFGLYNIFIQERLVRDLPRSDLPVALRWMADLIRSHPEPNYETAEHFDSERFDELAVLSQNLYRRGVSEGKHDGTLWELVSLADALVQNHQWRHYPTFHGNDYRISWEEESVRQDFARELLRRRAQSPNLFYELCELNAIRPTDLDWLLNWLDNEANSELRRAVAEISARTFDIYNHAQYEAIFAAADRHVEFAEYKAIIHPYIELDSPLAGFLREEAARQNRPPNRRPAPSAEELRKEAELCLQSIEQGDASFWWRLAWCLSCDLEQGHSRLYDTDMQSWVGWQCLSAQDRAKSIDAAWRYILNAEMPLDEWWATPGAGDYRAVFGHLALDYFIKTDPLRLQALPHAVWERWAPVLLSFVTNNPEVEARGSKLAALCHAAVPDIMVARVGERLRMLVSNGAHHVQVRKVLKGIWDEPIAAVVAEIVESPEIDELSLDEGIILLLEHGHPSGEALLRNAIEGKETGTRRCPILAAGIRQDHGRRWHEIWPVLKSDSTLARQVLARDVDGNFLGEMTALSAQDLADLYLSLRVVTPPDQLGPQYVSPRSPPPWFLPSIINHLISSGSEEGCGALAQIRDSGPDTEWASRAIIQCREILRLRNWQAPSPSGLLKMMEDTDRRFVRDGDDLLELLMASLSRYQQALPIEDLWNTRPCHTPKSEKALSDHVIRHLRQDLLGRALLANREVEIETLGGGAEIERVDILVEAFILGRKDDVVRAVIEVKGCWNKDLLTSMETQLSDRYLTDNGIGHGIYLVGWFLCPLWREPDSGRAAMAKGWRLDLDGAKRRFEQQAAELSSHGRRITAFVLNAHCPE
jgi:hypothetical protein